jgi:hypothetical protein
MEEKVKDRRPKPAIAKPEHLESLRKWDHEMKNRF